MFVVTLINILAFFFSLLDSRRILKNGLAFGFIIITIIACIRYNYGNDYMSYMRDFGRVGQYSLSYIFENQEQLQYSDALFKDLGAVTLFRIFHPFGFFFFAGLISISQGCIYYQFIKENVKREYYWIAMFLYVFQFEFYLLPMSMIRQGFSIALLVWSWHFIKHEKIAIPIFLALISISIHKSAVVFVPFIFIARYIKFNNGKLLSMILLIVLVFMIGSSSLINSIFEKIVGADAFTIYVNSYGDEASGEMGMIRKILAFLPFVLSLYGISIPNTSAQNRTLLLLSAIGILILPFTSIIALISRLCYYFNIFTIAAIPISLKCVKNKLLRYGVCTVILLSTLYQYFDIFKNSVYTKSFAEYQTIFSAPVFQ